MRARRILLLGLGAIVGAACKKETPAGPEAGDLTVSYTGPSQTDGALLLLVQGGPHTSVRAAGGQQVASASAGINITRVVVTGDLVPGDILRLSVPDVAAVASYSVRVEAAADRTTFALADPSSYTTTVRR